jgi:hypothetical protein
MSGCYYNSHKNKKLYELFEKNKQKFIELSMTHFKNLKDIFLRIPTKGEDFHYSNGAFPPLDAIGVGILLLEHKDTQHVVEIGCGNTSKLFSLLRQELNLKFELTCIDPEPRIDIKQIPDNFIQSNLENINIDELVEKINSKTTILFIDSSHIVKPSSDCTLILSELISSVKPGTIIHFHDIFLPDDYPNDWVDRGYNEQYTIANYLLNSNKYSLLWGSHFIGTHMEIKELSNFFSQRTDLQKTGGSLWIQIISE